MRDRLVPNDRVAGLLGEGEEVLPGSYGVAFFWPTHFPSGPLGGCRAEILYIETNGSLHLI
jgi:hypothetical protein